MRRTDSLAHRTIVALAESENGALTDLAIREVCGSMRAVPHLLAHGLVTSHPERCWVESEDNVARMELRDVVTVRLTDAGRRHAFALGY